MKKLFSSERVLLKNKQYLHIFRIMRLTIYLLLLFTGFAFADNAHSQNARVNLNKQRVELKEVLEDIESQTDYLFISNRDIDLESKVSIRVKNKAVREVLDQLLKDTDLTYAMEGVNIILSQKAEEQSLPQQNKQTIRGVITDNNGDPIIGANILEKETANGVVTDIDGKFSIVVNSNAILLISYIGYITQEINTSNQDNLKITLREDAMALEEVVVVGYGSIRREAVTGAVERAKLNTYKSVPTNNVLDMLKGSIAGLNVNGTNKAGQVAELSIRGQNSTSGNSPLLVVDGAIYNGSIADISSYDIENFTVLKDASAAAVYGSRSANGVILIETKKGSGINGKPAFNVNLNYGFSNEMERLKVYEGDAYLQRMLDSREANKLEADPSKIDIYLTDEERKNYMATSDHRPTLTDPYDLIRQTAYNQNINVNVSNRTDNLRYYIGTSIINQKGVVLNDQFKNVSTRMNIDSDVTSWLNIGFKSFYSFRNESGSSPNNTAVMFSPWASVYNEDGTYKQYPQTTTSFNSPFWSMASEHLSNHHNLNGIATALIKVPMVEGLSYSTTFSNSLRWAESGSFYDRETIEGKGNNGVGRRAFSRTYNMLWDNLVKYNRTFLKRHEVDVTLLASQEKSSWRSQSLYAKDFDNMVLGTNKLENGKTQTVDTGGGKTEAIGLMARATYTFDKKYSITGTVRRDGYSAFSKNKKFSTFPSIGINWNISRENFMKEIRFVDNLAIRASYGTNGNQSISAYQTLAKVDTDKYLFYGDPSYTVTQYISSLANNDLSWESTTGLNLGVDFGVLNNRINGAINYYRTKTNDLLFTLPLPTTSGMSSILSNVGEIQNKGVEISLNTLNIDGPEFKWYSNFSFSLNRNKVVTILGEDNDGDGIEDDLISAGYFIGKPLGAIYDYKIIGMWQQEDMDNGSIMQGLRPGDYKIDDIDKDGKISSDKDRQFLGNDKENFRWSWTNTFDYKGFSLMLYIYSIWGGNGWYKAPNTPYLDGYAGRGDINHPVYDYWTPRNTNSEFPRLDYNNAAYKAKTYYDRSFIKLQKASLSYDITKWVKNWSINSLKVTLSADNLFTYAPHWEGLDPETKNGLSDSAIPSIRTYIISLSLNF